MLLDGGEASNAHANAPHTPEKAPPAQQTSAAVEATEEQRAAEKGKGPAEEADQEEVRYLDATEIPADVNDIKILLQDAQDLNLIPCVDKAAEDFNLQDWGYLSNQVVNARFEAKKAARVDRALNKPTSKQLNLLVNTYKYVGPPVSTVAEFEARLNEQKKTVLRDFFDEEMLKTWRVPAVHWPKTKWAAKLLVDKYAAAARAARLHREMLLELHNDNTGTGPSGSARS